MQLTVVVKARFTVVHDGVATPAGPDAIVPRDRHLDGHPLRSVEAASDLAPYLARCDVVFVGHAYAPGGLAPAGSVRIGISREGRHVLDKTIHVFGDRAPGSGHDGGFAPKPPPVPFTRVPIVYEKAFGGPSEANPIGTDAPNLVDPKDGRRPAGFGPIARIWPVRKRLLGSLDGKAIEAPGAELPEGMPWDYFQAAPPDQQVDHLHGGEWLVLDGLHPTLARVQTRLPAVRGAARVVVLRAHPGTRPGAGPDDGVPAAEQAPELVCDTLAIDGDRQTFSLTWRGRCEVPEGEGGPPSLLVVGALEAPGVPVDWARLVAGARRASVAPPAPAPAEASSLALDSTLPVVAVKGGPAMPFAKDVSAAAVLARLPSTPAPAARPKPDKATMALSLDQLAPPQAALPFEAIATAPSRPPPPLEAEARDAEGPAAVAGAPWSGVPPPPVPRPAASEPDTAELPPIDRRLLPREPEIAPAPPPPPADRDGPPPRVPRDDPWARAPAPPPEPAPPQRPQAPPAFERPAAAAVKGSFYAKFKK
jgi:hypothetical protein